MATLAFHTTTNHDKNFPNIPTPPDSYNSAQNASTMSFAAWHAPADGLPHWKTKLRLLAHENYATNINHVQQRRRPLGVPAALRRSDHPGGLRNLPPDSPPGSQGKPFQLSECDMDGGEHATMATERRENLSILTPKLADEFPFRHEGLEEDHELDVVMGPPTTAHWKPDEMAEKCAICQETFHIFFLRRHHCRRCGNIVCFQHFGNKVPLDHNARLHPHGRLSKACDRCVKEWEYVQWVRESRASSISGPHSAPAESSSQALAIPATQRHRLTDEHRANSVARSEGGFNWSTF